MSTDTPVNRLSRISTCWSAIFDAHRGDASTVASARCQLLERYCGPIYRYAVAALGDADAAEEVLQNFALCFVRGDLRGANPETGRFRDLVKTVLFHLIVNYQRERKKRARSKPIGDAVDQPDPKIEAQDASADRQFLDHWREELLNRTWAALAKRDRYGRHGWYVVLQRHAEHPGETSQQLARWLSANSERSVTPAGVRQILHRAREQFANLLIDEIGRSIENSQREAIERELIDLELLIYCKSTLERRYPAGS